MNGQKKINWPNCIIRIFQKVYTSILLKEKGSLNFKREDEAWTS